MNRFRTKKKNKEEAAAVAAAAAAAAAANATPNAGIMRASTEDNHSFMGFRRNKKAPEEVKEEIDLSSALPASDDFRTSLLMTGLSARFSMLREQDDPSTKIGKALDDSVLFSGGSGTSTAAKRQSRMMMDFGGFRGLDDIAEVESIRGMRPPPFMRTHSFASDTDSLGDSVMNRTRPTDGNNLFGGRQKIYRIPAGATSSKSVADGGMGGRALYDDDVALSAFQKLRQEKKDQFLQYGYSSDDNSNNNMSASRRNSHRASVTVNSLLLSADAYESTSPYLRSESPSPIDYTLRRETSSTTSSGGGARNSTAATSVVSQSGGGLASSLGKEWQSPLLDSSKSDKRDSKMDKSNDKDSSSTNTNAPPVVERNTTMRIRRLYEQGLNQDMHEQQSSALSRIDTLSGKRMLRSKTSDLGAWASPSPTPSFGFKDSFNLSLNNLNSLSGNANTSPSVTSTLERLERRQALAKSSSTNLRSISPPMSGSSIGSPLPGTISARTSSEGLSGLNMMGGVGLGLNRKISGASGVSRVSGAGSIAGSGPTSPPLSPPISESGVEMPGMMPIQPNDVGKATAMGMFPKPTQPYDETRFAQRQLQLQQGRETPTETETERARPDSKLQQSFLFDGDDDDDDDESNYGDARSQKSVDVSPEAANPQVMLQRPSDADHPAFRQQSPAMIPEEPEAIAEIPTTTVTMTGTETDDKDRSAPAGGEPVDSPTLGPGGGLSGMVLQHLRSTSNASSVYSMVSRQNGSFDPPAHTNHLNFEFGDSVANSGTGNSTGGLDLKLSHPWDDSNNWTNSIYSSISTSESLLSDKKTDSFLPPLPAAPPPPVPATLYTASSTPTQAPPTQTPLTPRAPAPTEPTRRAPSLRSVSSRSRMTNSIADSNRSSSHTDNVSIIPGENEDDDFASQLANARRRVQERLTTYAESEGSRSSSPQLVATEPTPMLSSLQPLTPTLPQNQNQSQSQPSSTKSNPLGILRAKSSRGSLLERTREAAPAAPPVPSPSLPKMLGLGASTMSTAPSAGLVKQSFERSSIDQFDEPSPAESQPASNAPRSSTSTEEYADDDEDKSVRPPSDGNGNAVHPGLLAFRNARRQLQKRKELDTLGRHSETERSASATPPPMAMSSSPAHSRSPPRQRRPTMSAKQPPPVSYEPSRDGRSSSNGMRSRSGSRTGAATPDMRDMRDMRDRSGSETSNNGYSRHGPPPRIRTANPGNGQSRYDDRSQPSSPVASSGPNSNGNHLGALPARPGMLAARSPGLPGTDIRRSPHMPPQGYSNGSNGAPVTNGNNLSVRTAMGGRSPSGGNSFNPSTQPSPISPLSGGNPPFAGNGERSGPPTPTGIPRMMQSTAQRPAPGGAPSYSTTSSSLNETMKRTVRKAEISEPTFVMSTSRVPTMSLAPHQQATEMDPVSGSGSSGGSRSRSNSRARAPPPVALNTAAAASFVPPLPPINPLRKQPGSRTPRGILSGFRRTNTNSESHGDEMDTMSALTMPSMPLNSSASTSNLNGATNSSSSESDVRPPLRKQASEASGMHSRLNQQRMNLPGGMI